jgi:hypothetical protein
MLLADPGASDHLVANLCGMVRSGKASKKNDSAAKRREYFENSLPHLLVFLRTQVEDRHSITTLDKIVIAFPYLVGCGIAALQVPAGKITTHFYTASRRVVSMSSVRIADSRSCCSTSPRSTPCGRRDLDWLLQSRPCPMMCCGRCLRYRCHCRFRRGGRGGRAGAGGKGGRHRGTALGVDRGHGQPWASGQFEIGWCTHTCTVKCVCTQTRSTTTKFSTIVLPAAIHGTRVLQL